MERNPQSKLRQSTRLRGYNYRDVGSYFITILTHHRRHYFGEMEKGKMHLTEVGQLAEQNWQAIPEHHPHIALGEYVFMPDHMHGILHITSSPLNAGSAVRKFSLPDTGSISTVIRTYKASVTRECKKKGWVFKWHTRFYDKILRTQRGVEAASAYIRFNPEKWEEKYGSGSCR